MAVCEWGEGSGGGIGGGGAGSGLREGRAVWALEDFGEREGGRGDGAGGRVLGAGWVLRLGASVRRMGGVSEVMCGGGG